MNSKQDPRAAILIEETHHYDVDLGEISYAAWQKAEGSIQVRIPYDAKVFKDDASTQEKYHIGNLLISQPNGDEAEPETFSIDIEAGSEWSHHLKSAKRAVCQANYTVSQPRETLVSIQGEVRDFSGSFEEVVTGKISSHNPLHLQVHLWIPDLFSTNVEDEVEEIEKMLLQREHVQQIFMELAISDFETKLAENLVALANTRGGTIIVGVNKKGKVTGLSKAEAHKIPGILLKAALKTNPFVPLKKAKLFSVRGNQRVYVIGVLPSIWGTTYTFNDSVYRRQEKHTINVAKATNEYKTSQGYTSAGKLDNILDKDDKGNLVFKSTDKAAVLYGVREDEIGHHICAMINAELDQAQIIIRNPPQPERAFFSRQTIRQSIGLQLKQAVDNIIPTVSVYERSVELVEHDDELLALITIPGQHIPLALYKEQGFIWRDKRLETISLDNLLDKYLNPTKEDVRQDDQRPVRVEKASVSWQIRPAERTTNQGAAGLINVPYYSVQRQELVWKPKVDSFNEESHGFETTLNLPLTNVSLKTGENGAVVQSEPIINGQITVSLNDILVSGLEVVMENDSSGELKKDSSQALPIVKRTFLVLNFAARLNEIFKHRRSKLSLLRFYVSDVIFDHYRALDLVQVCSDAGFRVYDTLPDSPVPGINVRKSSVENNRLLVQEGSIVGIRSNHFHDIHLNVFLSCQPSTMTRELRYEDVHDVAETKTYTLEIWIMLQGKGEGVGSEIGLLQMQLYEMIRRRLQQLGAD